MITNCRMEWKEWPYSLFPVSCGAVIPPLFL
jgi:hypothetical protein